jgi:translation elongation factor EF-Ts
MEKFRTELTLCRQAYLKMADVSVKMMIQMAYPGIQQDAPVIDLPFF